MIIGLSSNDYSVTFHAESGKHLNLMGAGSARRRISENTREKHPFFSL